MPKFYCLMCKRETQPADDSVEDFRTKNGKLMLKCSCGMCGKKVTSFASKSDAEVYAGRESAERKDEPQESKD